VLSSGRQSETPVDLAELARIVPELAGRSSIVAGAGRALETGIKVIDVMCPLVAGGHVVIAGELGTGIAVVMHELVQRLKGGPDGVKLFALMPLWPDSPPGWSIAAELKKEGYSDIPDGAVQTFFFRTENGPWTENRLSALDQFDVVIHLSRERGRAKVYPTVDVLTSRSRLLQANAVSDGHAAISERARRALAFLWAVDGHPNFDADNVTLERALKLQNYFTQPSSRQSPTRNVPARPSPQRKRCAHAERSSTGATTTCPWTRSFSVAIWPKSEGILGGHSHLVQSRFSLRRVGLSASLGHRYLCAARPRRLQVAHAPFMALSPGDRSRR
jgi:hypothetical protein